jgi:hypothetical protein
MLGYVVVVKPYRKHGNGAKGGGRQESTGKKCSLFKINEGWHRELVASTVQPTAKAAVKEIRSSTRVIPQHVAINHNGETYF